MGRLDIDVLDRIGGKLNAFVDGAPVSAVNRRHFMELASKELCTEQSSRGIIKNPDLFPVHLGYGSTFHI